MTDGAVPADVTKPESSGWRGALWEFAVHIIVGTGIFLIIYAPAVGLNLLVKWMVSSDVNWLTVLLVQTAECSLIIADTFLFLVFLVKTTWRAIKKL